jgi:hypothetical protein
MLVTADLYTVFYIQSVHVFHCTATPNATRKISSGSVSIDITP